jgi:hypothetical protein
MVGGFSAEKPADDEIRALFEVDSVRFSAADKLGQTVDSLVVISYQTQVVRKLLVQFRLFLWSPHGIIAIPSSNHCLLTRLCVV